MSTATVHAARGQLIQAALQALAVEHSTSWSSADADRAEVRLALAARDLTRTIDAQPEAARPAGWGDVPGAAVVSMCGGCPPPSAGGEAQ